MRRSGPPRWAVWVAAGLAASTLAACGAQRPKPVDFSDVAHVYGPDDYDVVRDRWTRHDQVVRDIGTVIELWATLKTWDFRQAFVERYVQVYGLPEPERTGLRRTQQEAARTAYEFHVAVQSTDYRWNDLEQKDSPWKVVLVDGHGAEISPTSIEVLKLPEIYEMTFFPMRNDFTRTYLIRFVTAGGESGSKTFAGTASGRLALRVAGPLGRAELVWQSK